jgi:transcriptional regulator with XRE-family HTH domain
MLSERLKLAMQKSGVNQAELARACGVKPPSVNGWLSGKSKFLRGENLLAAARALNVSQSWLATGKGSMQPKNNISGEFSPDEIELIKIYQEMSEEGKEIAKRSITVLASIHPSRSASGTNS